MQVLQRLNAVVCTTWDGVRYLRAAYAPFTCRLKPAALWRIFCRRLVEEAWNQAKIEVVDEILADDFVLHDPTAPERRNRDDYKQWIAASRIAFPDLQLTIDNELVDGEQIATRWTVRGTHQGDLVEPTGTIPPTGRQIKITGITIARLANGKLVEGWQVGDTLGYMMQLGILPASVQAGV